MVPEWYCTQNGAQQGPFTEADLKQRAVSGLLKPTDHVWKQGMANWVPAASIPGLIASPARPAAPTPAARPSAAAPSPVSAPAAAGQPAAAAAWQAKLKDASVKAKTAWNGWTTPVKIGVVAGAVAVLFFCLFLPMVLAFASFVSSFGRSSNYAATHSSTNAGATTTTTGGRPSHGSRPGDFNWNPDDNGDMDQPSGNGKPQHAHKEMTQDELDELSLSQIEARLGRPDETYRGTNKTNVVLAVWASGDDKYITVSYIEAIDGSGDRLILTRNVDRTRAIVENQKRAVANQ